MNFTYCFILVSAYVSFAQSSIYTKVRDDVISFLQRSIANYGKNTDQNTPSVVFKNDQRKAAGHNKISNLNSDVKIAHEKARALKRMKGVRSRMGKDDPLNQLADENTGAERYKKDPVLNFWARRSAGHRNAWGDASSSSLELQNWKDEWREHWIQKKYEAINSTPLNGDTVNMLAARPWGVTCGDPNQHDMPWGSCMLAQECEAEYRIYRGDYFCGRTQFVCCALQLTTYDMYQGFDVSFADSDMLTDSEEKRNRQAGSKERKRKAKRIAKERRTRNRLRRKRAIRKNISKIIKEIKKILSTSYRNGTTARKKKTQQLKRFVKFLKRQYKKDRKSVKDIHEMELIKIDRLLQQKLAQIIGMNREFIKNHKFRDLVVNGSISPKAVRTLVEAYPELVQMLDKTRRSSGRSGNLEKPDYLEYDIEYGLLYY